MELFRGDCLKVMAKMPDGCVDAVITDQPYGIGYENNRKDIRPWQVFAPPIIGDESQETGQAAIDECFRRGWPVCTFAHHRQPWLGHWRQHLVWDKGPGVGGGGDIRTCWKFTWELIQVSGFGHLNGKRDSAVLRFWARQNCLHPNQKPLGLLCYLIEKLTKPGQTVLDPFMGSGTTGVACQRLGRSFIGIELDPTYFRMAKKRLRDAEKEAAGIRSDGKGTVSRVA